MRSWTSTALPAEQARRISRANEGLMRSCDALVANLTPFRGVSMDSGTAFEVGFMQALGRPLGAGYTNVTADYSGARGHSGRAGRRRWIAIAPTWRSRISGSPRTS